jgi:hypothetical protein
MEHVLAGGKRRDATHQICSNHLFSYSVQT